MSCLNNLSVTLYKAFCSPPKTKLNLINKHNKSDSKIFGSLNHDLHKNNLDINSVM